MKHLRNYSFSQPIALSQSINLTILIPHKHQQKQPSQPQFLQPHVPHNPQRILHHPLNPLTAVHASLPWQFSHTYHHLHLPLPVSPRARHHSTPASRPGSWHSHTSRTYSRPRSPLTPHPPTFSPACPCQSRPADPRSPARTRRSSRPRSRSVRSCASARLAIASRLFRYGSRVCASSRSSQWSAARDILPRCTERNSAPRC